MGAIYVYFFFRLFNFVVVLQIDRKTHRPKESLSVLADVLQSVKRSEFKDCHLAWYKVRVSE